MLQYGEATSYVGQRHSDMPIKAPRSHKSLVESFRKVGSADQDDALGLGESVKLDQQLIEGYRAYFSNRQLRCSIP